MMKNKFRKIMKNIISDSDISLVPTKYTNVDRNYARISRIVHNLQNLKLTKGMDFGCGMCFCTILGKLNGIDITGLDIPSRSVKIGLIRGVGQGAGRGESDRVRGAVRAERIGLHCPHNG